MNLWRVKLELTYHGMRLDKEARQKLSQNRFGIIVYRDYSTTGGIILKLDEDTYANTPIDQKKCDQSPYLLIYTEEQFHLKKKDGEEIPVEILPTPQFALDSERLLSSGEFVRDLVMFHADRIRISPVYGCSNACIFCSMASLPYQCMPVKKLDEAFNVALKDPLSKDRFRHAFISGGTPRAIKLDYQYLNKVYQYFPRKYPEIDFDAMLSPRTLYPGRVTKQKYLNFLNYLYSCKLKDISINLELVNESLRRKMIPQKDRIGMDNYLLFIGKAVEIFGAKRVRSSIIIGLEDEKETLWGVNALAKRGCIPVLSQFVPTPGTPTAQHLAPTPDFQEQVLLKSIEIVTKHNLTLGPLCKACSHNSVVNYNH
jgi:hypothetical protein